MRGLSAHMNTRCRTFPVLLGLQVTSGQLAALGLPVAVMSLDASKLIDTYGKTWLLAGGPRPRAAHG